MSNNSSDFQCFNCSKHLPSTEHAKLPIAVLAPASLVFLVLSQSLRWPSDVCKNCSNQVYLFAVLGSLFTLALLYIAI